MKKQLPSKNFRVALSLAGISAVEFAKKHGVSRQAVYQTMNGAIKSARLEKAINRFIRSEISRLNGRAVLDSAFRDLSRQQFQGTEQ